MPKFKLSVPVIVAAMMGAILYGWLGYSQSAQPRVQLTTTPPISQVLPFEAEAEKPQSPVSLSLQVRDAAGQPLENAKIQLQILTPPKNPWLTTDFPIVEGTKLLEMEAVAPKGELQVQQILPIRGTYQLRVNATPLVNSAFTPIQETLTLKVAENPVKYRNFVILAAILLFIGLGGGLILGGRQIALPGEIAPQRVRLLLSGACIVAIAALLVVNISAEMAESHVHSHEHQDHHSHAADEAATPKQQGIDVKFLGDDSSRVGQLAEIAVQSRDLDTGQSATDVVFKVKATRLEGNDTVFAYQGSPDANGELRWKQQFFDGAPHKLEVQVSPQPNAARQFQPFQVSKEIEVEGVAPPLYVRLIGLIYFTSFLLLGVLLGLWLKRDRRFGVQG